jgi:hypothetical protein
VKYVPIEARKRKRGRSKIKFFHDGIRFFMIIVKICTLYSPMRVFLPVSFLMFILGLAWYVYTFIFEGRFTNMSALLFTTSITIFMMSLISEQISQMRFERRGSERVRLVAEVPDRFEQSRDARSTVGPDCPSVTSTGPVASISAENLDFGGRPPFHAGKGMWNRPLFMNWPVG